MLTVAAAVAVVGCVSTSTDTQVLVPWLRIGDIALGASKEGVERKYGSPGHGYQVIQRDGNTVQGYYRLHGSRVIVTFYGDRVGELDFTKPYYRTKGGFGVGSRIPLGPCHKTTSNTREHRWNGFIFGPQLREQPCSCWVKVGRRPQTSRPVSPPLFA